MRSAPTDPIKQDYEAEIPRGVKMPMAVLWFRITSYNVCYTKLLRRKNAKYTAEKNCAAVLYTLV